MSTPTRIELAEIGAARAASSAARQATWRRLLRLRWGVGAAGMLLLIVASAAFAPLISPHDPLAVDIRHRLSPPAWMDRGTTEHLLGTDQVGRDLLTRMIYGGRVSLVVGVIAVLMSTTIGGLLGVAAGHYRGHTPRAIMNPINRKPALP